MSIAGMSTTLSTAATEWVKEVDGGPLSRAFRCLLPPLIEANSHCWRAVTRLSTLCNYLSFSQVPLILFCLGSAP